MSPAELDECYTRLCRALTEAGEPAAAALLARLVLLLMQEVGDPERIQRAIDEAAASGSPLPPAAP